jgi:hypothetical protein
MGKAAAKKDAEETRGIEDTLTVLEIDKDADPEDAAQSAAHEVASSVVVEEAKTPEKKKAAIPDPDAPKPDEEDDEDDEDDEDEDDEGIVIPPPKASAPLPDPEEAPILIPAPKPPKARTRQAPSGAAKLGKELANKVPGAEKVKVYKREKDGKVWFIHEYTKGDLAGHSDFEGFLTEYVKDEHGAGEYTLKGVDGMGREMDLGVVRLKGAAKKGGDHGALSIIQEIMAANQRRDAEYLKRMEDTMRPQPQQDPLSLLTGVMTLQKQMKDEADMAGGAAAAQASSGMEAMMKMFASSGDKTMQMMMMMMQQQQAAAQQQQNIMMQLLAKPKEEDPVTKLLLMKLLEDKNEGSNGSGGLPPPPPPPPKDNTVELITALGGFMAAMGGGGGDGDDDFKEFLKSQLATMSQDKLSTKDVLELVGKFKDEAKGSDKLKEAADNMALVMNMAHNLNRTQEGGASATVFDALAALFSNRDFAGSIAQTIRQKVGAGGQPQVQVAQLTPQQQYAVSQLPPQQQQAFRQLPPQQQVAVAQRAVALQQQAQAQQPSGATPQPAGLPPGYVMTPQGPAPAAGGPPVPATGPAPSVPSEATQRAAEQQLAQSRKFPELPANTYEHVQNLANASDEAELVGKTIAMLIYFAEFEAWRQFSETVLGLARDGNQAGCMEYLEAFFSGMAEIHMIDPALAQKTLAALRDNFEVVQEQLTDLGLEEDELLTGDDLLAGADLGEEDEGDDVGEGGDPVDPT